MRDEADGAPHRFILHAEIRARAGEAREFSFTIDCRQPQVSAQSPALFESSGRVGGSRGGSLVDIAPQRQLARLTAELDFPGADREVARHAERQQTLVELI